MENRAKPTCPSSIGTHFVDIHEVLPEEEEEEEEGMTRMAEKARKGSNRQFKVREAKRPFRNLSRQVSLETGFSAFHRETRAKDEIRVLPRRKEREMESQRVDGDNGPDESAHDTVPAGRYFAALRGPELDQVKQSLDIFLKKVSMIQDYEDILLPKDEKWPFLLRFPIGCFGICLGLSSQAVLWRALAASPATQFLHITPFINLALWLLSLAVLIPVSFTYILKCIFYFEAVKREYFHPVRVNFFFAPWVVCMLLAISVPPMLAPDKTASCPLVHLHGTLLLPRAQDLRPMAVRWKEASLQVGNFVGAILASKVGWKEAAKFLWAVGFAHYLVVFVTLYQRLPTSEALPKELHPVYSMFIAAPSAASIAWETIYGDFDGLSRTCYFIALFLYVSLVARINFFTGFGFSVAWWSYTFPMTTASVATIKYAENVPWCSKQGPRTCAFFHVINDGAGVHPSYSIPCNSQISPDAPIDIPNRISTVEMELGENY
ncbi:hypothetical protein OIU84_022317 [Salix udensis]|uniref:Uncharacterized protein n=1 Tax=Salix udensis TaxID=889485 RepID=A0AAD6PF05_9ROSI|nr:hypothetical protein OIU84_022317 [Salix udensis]